METNSGNDVAEKRAALEKAQAELAAAEQAAAGSSSTTTEQATTTTTTAPGAIPNVPRER